jgi:hypothetical protein
MARSPLTFPFGPVGKKLKMLLKKIKNYFRTPAQIFQGAGFKKLNAFFMPIARRVRADGIS